jgi:lipoate-protein ligase A
MNSGWRILREVGGSAGRQMARDEALAREATPTLRLFSWDPPAVSVGRRQRAPAWLRATGWRAAGLEWVERPTGGGLAVHGSDLSVAVVVPRALELPLSLLMSSVCQSAARLCRTFGAPAEPLADVPGCGRVTACLAETSPYAVVVSAPPGIATAEVEARRKLGGFALRRYPDTWLIQGSLLIEPLPSVLAQALPPSLARRLAERAVPLAEAAAEPADVPAAMTRWAECWAGWWEEFLLGALAPSKTPRSWHVSRGTCTRTSTQHRAATPST